MIVHWLWAICNSISEGDSTTEDIELVTCDECLMKVTHVKQFMYEESDE